MDDEYGSMAGPNRKGPVGYGVFRVDVGPSDNFDLGFEAQGREKMPFTSGSSSTSAPM